MESNAKRMFLRTRLRRFTIYYATDLEIKPENDMNEHRVSRNHLKRAAKCCEERARRHFQQFP